MATLKNSITPLQIRPYVGPTDNLSYLWSFDNQWTASPIVEDFNGDGFDDFIWIQSNYRTGTNSYDQDGQVWPTYPFVYFQSQGDGSFFDNTSAVFPGGQFIGMSASRYIFEDLDGDKITDFLIIDQGYESIEDDPLIMPDMLVGDALLDNDGQPWSVEISHQGAVLSWWKGNADGTFKRHVINDGYMAFHHNGDAADIDLDGDKEIVIANAGTFLSVNQGAIDTFLNPIPNNRLLYGGAISSRVTDENILAAGFRPVIPLELNAAGEYELNFEILPKDGMFSIVHENGSFRELLAVGTITLADVNDDGYPDMLAGVGNSYPGAPTFNRIYLNQSGVYSAENYIALPFPGVAVDLVNKNSAVFIDIADIDGNGLIDIAIGFENPGNGMGAGHFIQIFKQSAPLVFQDVTLESIGTYITRDLLEVVSAPYGSEGTWGGGPSWLRFEDLNGDGHQDIAMFTQLVGFYELGGAFLINDGLGNFSPLHNSNFSAPGLRDNISYPNQDEYNYQAIYGDFNGDGLKDNLVIEYEFWGYSEKYPNSLREPAYLYTQTQLAEAPISRVANGYKIWSEHTPAFNEFYYANKYPDATVAVAAGEYATLYDFYNLMGKYRGDTTVAPNTEVLGTANTIDCVDLSGRIANFELTLSDEPNEGRISNEVWGVLYLNQIERLSFLDASLALDIEGNAGTAAKILGALWGKESLENPAFVGIVLHYLDSGVSYEALLDLALGAILGTNKTNEAIVELVVTNLVGEAPTQGVKTELASYMDSGAYSQAGFARAIADLELNATNINLVGLSDTGLQYTEYVP